MDHLLRNSGDRETRDEGRRAKNEDKHFGADIALEQDEGNKTGITRDD